MSDQSVAASDLIGSADLRLPDALRVPLREHLEDLRRKYLQRGWGERVGFGQRPALMVIDLAQYWTRPCSRMGSNLDAVVVGACRVLEAARRTSYAHGGHGVRPLGCSCVRMMHLQRL